MLKVKHNFMRKIVFACVLFCTAFLTGYYFLDVRTNKKTFSQKRTQIDDHYVLPPGVQKYIEKLNKTSDTESQILDVTIAEVLKSKVRVLCLILMTEDILDTKGNVVKYTWARRCTKYMFMLKTDIQRPDVIYSPFAETRKNLIHKVKFSLQYVYENYINDFDWIIKADHDTYVIVENLRYLLKHYNSKEPGYLGFHFNKYVVNGYMSGGAGYVISNGGLRHLVEYGFDREACPVVPNDYDAENSEDIEIARCLNITGVPVLNSLDSANKETFHPYPLEQHLTGSLPSYIYEWSNNPQETGPGCCSQFAITFHYMTPEAMVLVDHLLYKTSVYGRNTLADTDNAKDVFNIGKVAVDPSPRT